MAKPLIGARTMRGLRALAERAMQDHCVIVRDRVLDDGAGGTYPHPDGPDRLGPFPCRFAARDGDEQDTGDQVQARGDYEIGLPTWSPEVKDTDTIEIFRRSYQVVWTPPIDALATERTVGMDEIGRKAVA